MTIDEAADQLHTTIRDLVANGFEVWVTPYDRIGVGTGERVDRFGHYQVVEDVRYVAVR